MARQEEDREDLMGEATALVERAEIAIADYPDSIVIGFRREGGISIYAGADPVYHFNALGQLRRAFVKGLLYKADGGRLVSLQRVRTPAEVQLVRHELDVREQQSFLAAMQAMLGELSHCLDAGGYQLIGQVPEEADVVSRLQAQCPTLLRAVIADSPRVG